MSFRTGEDGRIVWCPLCQCRTTYGSLRSHVASARCLAQATRHGVILGPEHRALMQHAFDLDAEITKVMKLNRESHATPDIIEAVQNTMSLGNRSAVDVTEPAKKREK